MTVRLPLMMMMRKVAPGGGGGPTISSIETLPGSVAAGAAGTPTITTSLVSTDRVVVLLQKSSTTGTPTISGLGATWTAHINGSSLADHMLWSASGITGGGTVTITPNGSGVTGDYVVYVLRASDSHAVTHHGSAANTGTVSAGTNVTAADITSTTEGMFAVAAARANNPTLSFPDSDMLPVSGWTTDDTGDNTGAVFISQQLPSGVSTVRAIASSSSIASIIVQAGVFA